MGMTDRFNVMVAGKHGPKSKEKATGERGEKKERKTFCNTPFPIMCDEQGFDVN